MIVSASTKNDDRNMWSGPDPDLPLFGHPENYTLANPASTGHGEVVNWVLFNMNMTAVHGPELPSANPTRQTPSGIGTSRSVHNVLLPSFWSNFAQFTDEEVRAIFACLKSIKVSPLRVIKCGSYHYSAGA